MSKPDDEAEEEDNIVGTSKYPCMPSLVALQQMRNRLQLAYLGKKLMKWTAMATGRELRRLAEELNRVYYNFHDDVRNAYMLLARARYFYPNLNKMVLQHVDKEASVQVVTTTKAITGVRTLIFDVVDSRKDSYLHLGIEKGGQAIETAKEAWLALLKRLVYIQQLRTGFALVDAANKHATKKMNVLGKIVIPRTDATIKYILNELEEIAREEFFRLKKILNIKNRLKKKEDVTCPICKDKTPKKKKERCIICGEPLHVEKDEFQIFNESKIEELKSHLSDIAIIRRDIARRGVVSRSVEDFLKEAEEVRDRLDNKGLPPIPSDVNLEKLCENCKKRFAEQQEAKKQKEEELEGDPDQFKESTTTVKSVKTLPLDGAQILESDLELGTFETDIEVITKIIRTRNEDGTISEEKKVIKIKKETRVPGETNDRTGRIMYQASDTSNKSNPYANPKTIGIVTIEDGDIPQFKLQLCPLERDAFSDILNSSLPLADPIERCCLSSGTVQSYDRDLEEIYSSLMRNKEQTRDEVSLDSTLEKILNMSTEFDDVVRSFDPLFSEMASTSNRGPEIHENYFLTESDRRLLSTINSEDSRCIHEIIEMDTPKELENKTRVTRSVSFNLNITSSKTSTTTLNDN